MYKTFVFRALAIVGLVLSALSLMLAMPATVQAQGPVSYWKLDETGGPPYKDFYNNHDGVCAAGGCPTSTAEGVVNGGQVFSGTGGIDVAAIPAANATFDWDTSDSFSIEFWMKAVPGQTCAASDEVIVGRTDSSTDLLWSLGCANTTGHARFTLSDTSGISLTLESTKVITDGNWHHLAGLRDATNGTNHLYVDGTEVASASVTYSGSFTSTSAALNLGYLASGSHFSGTLDEVALYDGVLSLTEMRTHYYLARAYTETCATPVRIMPLGDSITKGSGTTPRTGYRQPLYLSLAAAGYDVDFVGSQRDGQTATPSFDYDHEGHSGIRDDDVAANVYNWLVANPGDVALLHIGTNDMDAGVYDTSPNDIETILDEIDRYSEATTVILARIINRKTYSPETHQFNIDVAAMAEQRIANGDKIIIVDQENALIYPDDMFDDEHPNYTGYDKMADVWLDALDDFLPVCIAFAPTIISSAATEATVGQLYNYDVNATGNPPPTYTLAISPTNMTINAATGMISWTPVTTGTFEVTVEAANSAGTDSQSFTITVTAAPTIISAPVTEATVGQPYTYHVQATGEPAPTYTLITATTGMTIDAVTGVISWTPVATGTFGVTVKATNSAGTDSQNFSINVGAVPVIISAPVTKATVGQPYTYDVEATGDPAPTYTLITATTGMTIDAVMGVISWTPTTTGTFSVEVEAGNTAGTDSQSFSINVGSSHIYLPIILRNQ